ncbi:MAG: MATE family efflux transporter [Hyphomicrobiales bacterium]|nr:MATE family efflux transporter [Hyphomicrobiales bacterium]MCP5373301.1 MATE family efflux transporter [Hyphomicrobiales bacterium]
MLSNVSVPLLGAVDTAVVGRLPEPQHLGGVAVGAAIFSMVFWVFGFLRMGTTGPTAQALGAGDGDEVRGTLGRAALTALVLGAAVIAVQAPLAWAVFPLVGAEGAVADLGRSYYAIRVWGAPATLLNYALLGWLLGMQDARAALVLQLALNVTNMALDLWFVMGLGWGVQGVAVASVLAEAGAAALGLALVRRKLRGHPGAWHRRRVFDGARLRRMFAINGDIFVRTLCLQAAFFLFTAESARMGPLVLAANAVLLNLQHVMAYALDGFAHATEALTGHAIGARDGRRLRGALAAATAWAVPFAGAFALAYGVAGEALVGAMTTIPQVRATALSFLPWLVAAPLLSVWSYLLDGLFLGATRTAAMRNAMILSLALYVLALQGLVHLWGAQGLWAALMLLMVLRAATLGLALPPLLRAAAAAARPAP